MKAAKVAAGIVVVLAALYGFGRFFAGELGGGAAARRAEPAGVLFAPPPGFTVEERGEIGREAAARELTTLLAGRLQERRLGLHFSAGGTETYWLVERPQGPAADAAAGLRETPATVLTELAAGAGGTRVATTWRGSGAELERRLAWAAEHGSLEAPHLPAGESRNLYH